MSTATMTPANGTDRAALLPAAKGTPAAPAQRVPMGIRVTAGPGAPAAPATAEPTPIEVRRTVEELLRVAAGSEVVRTRKLAEVRQELRATGGDSMASPRNRREGAAERAAIRQWALANGDEVKDRGRVSRETRETYAAATGSEMAR